MKIVSQINSSYISSLLQPTISNNNSLIAAVVKKVSLSAIILLGCTLAAGTIYQSVSTKIDAYFYPPPGRMIDVGGFKMHINCMGDSEKKGPTVILEAGAGGCNSLEWSLVQPEVSQFARVCSYDRAGHGWSDESPYPRTSAHMVEELHTLLINAKIPGPYILVGHSFGGNHMRLFANKYPDEVSGVILVDSVHENMWDKLPPSPFETLECKLRYNNKNIARLASSIGFFRFFYCSPKDYNQFPDSIAKIYSKQHSSTKLITTLFEANRLSSESLSQVKGTTLGNKPLTVISAGHEEESITLEDNQIWNDFQKDLATKSSNSKHLIAQGSDHMITRTDPKIIIKSIFDMMRELNKNLAI